MNETDDEKIAAGALVKALGLPNTQRSRAAIIQLLADRIERMSNRQFVAFLRRLEAA